MSESSGEPGEKQDLTKNNPHPIWLNLLVILVPILFVIAGIYLLIDGKYDAALGLFVALYSIAITIIASEKLTSIFSLKPLPKESLIFYSCLFFLLSTSLLIIVSLIDTTNRTIAYSSLTFETLGHFQLIALILSAITFYLYRRQIEKNKMTLRKYVQKATEMYKEPEYMRVVTAVEKWSCTGTCAQLLEQAFKEVKAGEVIFLGHIQPGINFVGVIWRLNMILNCDKAFKFRICHLLIDDIHPLCLIGKRPLGRYKDGDLVLTVNDYNKEEDILAHEVNFRQKMIAFLLNDYIDAMFDKKSKVKNNEPERKTVEIRDGLLVCLEILKTYKNKAINRHYDSNSKELKDVKILGGEYVNFVANDIYGDKQKIAPHIMNKDLFIKLLKDFLRMLHRIKAVTYSEDTYIDFSNGITYEKALCRLNKCVCQKNSSGECIPNEN